MYSGFIEKLYLIQTEYFNVIIKSLETIFRHSMESQNKIKNLLTNTETIIKYYDDQKDIINRNLNKTEDLLQQQVFS